MQQIIKSVVRSIFVPPINSFKKSRTTEPVFSSYQQVLSFYGTHGYQERDLVEVVVAKNANYRHNILLSHVVGLDALRTMIGVGVIGPQAVLRVLDFGGGSGSHYSIVRALLGEERDIRWNVVETEAMATAAAKLAGGGLKFFDDVYTAVADLGDVDLVFTSGALQYTPDPLVFLDMLIAVKARHLFITRTPFSDGDEAIIGVQKSMLSSNGPGPLPSNFTDYEIRYPVTFASKRKAEQLLKKAYKIRFFIEEDKAAYSVQGRPFHMYGYFCDLKD